MFGNVRKWLVLQPMNQWPNVLLMCTMSLSISLFLLSLSLFLQKHGVFFFLQYYDVDMVTHLHSTSYTSLLIIVKGDLALTPREITLHDLHESNLFSFKEADSIKALYTICQLWDLSHTCSQFKHKKMPLAIPLHRTQPAWFFFPILYKKYCFSVTYSNFYVQKSLPVIFLFF